MTMPSSSSFLAIQEVLEPDRQLEQDDLDDFELNYPLSWSIVTGSLGCILGIVFLCAVLVLSSILRTILKNPSSNQVQSQQRRGPADTSKNLLQSFNIYLLFIILPDSLLNGFASAGLLWEATHEGEYAPGLCIARNSASFFHYFVNVYLNAVVGREVYILITNSHRRQKTLPPSLTKVACQVASVYIIMSVLVTWMMIEVPWSPSNVVDLTYCYQEIGSPDIDGKPGPVFNVWTGSIVALLIISPPVLYVLWIGYDVYSRNLLPIRGRTRAIAIYFFRIVMVFLFFYVPSLSLSFIYNLIPYQEATIRFWILMVFTAMIPVQCLVTLRVALEKSDVFKSFQSLTSCVSVLGFCVKPLASEDVSSSKWETDDVYASRTSRLSAGDKEVAAENETTTVTPEISVTSPAANHASSVQIWSEGV